jgi:hypothetical protein
MDDLKTEVTVQSAGDPFRGWRRLGRVLERKRSVPALLVQPWGKPGIARLQLCRPFGFGGQTEPAPFVTQGGSSQSPRATGRTDR